MEQQDKFLGQLIQIAPKVLAYAGEVQLIMGLYEVVSKAISGDRTSIYKAIIILIRNHLSPDQTNQIINIMKTAVTAIEYADALKGFLEQVIVIYNQQQATRSVMYSELDEILAIADRVSQIES